MNDSVTGFGENVAERFEALQRSSLFHPLPKDALYSLALSSRTLRFDDASTVFSEGDETGEQAYVVVHGKVRIFIGSAEQRLERRLLNVGDLFGEFALLGSGRRTASAEAVGKLTLMSIQAAPLIELIRAWPELALRMLKVQIERSIELERQLLPKP